MAGMAAQAASQTLRRTPGQILGPYYPLVRGADVNADLTRIAGHSRRADGAVVHIEGRVLDETGRPVPNARIEIWQADSRGHYAHPSDPTAGAADPDFQGYAGFQADGAGRYAFVTVKPGAYPDDGAGGLRAPHIHYQVTGRVNRLVTQMYFDGEPLNDTDRVLAFAQAARDRLMLRPDRAASSVLAGTWDIVLRDG